MIASKAASKSPAAMSAFTMTGAYIAYSRTAYCRWAKAMPDRMLSTMDVLTEGTIAAHRHRDAYAAVVRSGSYAETAVDGCIEVRTAMIVVHPALHLHANVVNDAGRVWNTPIQKQAVSLWGAFAGRGAERLAGLDRRPMDDEVLEALETCSRVARMRMPAWLSDLTTLGFKRFDVARKDVSREHAHRVFKAYFGMSPGRWRRERQLQCALARLAGGASQVQAAVDAGFSDQSHMCRVFRTELGATPGRFSIAGGRSAGTSHSFNTASDSGY